MISRPRVMKEVSYQDEALLALKKSVDERNVTHIPFLYALASTPASLRSSWNRKDIYHLGVGS